MRNVIRNVPRLRPMIVILSLSIALLFVGNSILESSNTGFEAAYRTQLTGDFTISPVSDDSFTLFGSEALLVGEYLVPPVLSDSEALRSRLESTPGIRRIAGVVTAAAQIEVQGQTDLQPLFGVEPVEYRQMFPDLKLVQGQWPEDGRPFILLNVTRYDELSARVGTQIEPGSPILLSVFSHGNFSLREVTLAGVFSYPIGDEILDRVALVDVSTARALNGYLYSPTPGLDQGIDDLFSDDLFSQETFSEDPPQDQGESLFDSLESLFSPLDTTEFEVQSPENLRAGAWNFLLVALEKPWESSRVQEVLRNQISPSDYLIRDWRFSVGGTPVIVWIIQVFFNGGLLFVTLGTITITMNSIVLSVLERTREIGTMRSLGASRGKTGLMIGLESLLVVGGSGILGLSFGVLIILLLNALGVGLSNPFLQALFGGSTLSGSVSVNLILNHLLGAFGLGVVSLMYPLKKVFAITPLQAMGGGV